MPVEPIAGIELPPITDDRHPSYEPEKWNRTYDPPEIKVPKIEPIIPTKSPLDKL